jgi:Ferritin-like domain
MEPDHGAPEGQQGALEGQQGASPARLSRAGLFARSFAVLGALGGSAIGASELAASPGAQRSPAHDQEILSFGLLVERLQAAFYAEVLHKERLTGEALQFAKVVGGQEQEHVKYFTDALGPSAPKGPKFQFGDATSDAAKFIATAISLEQAGLAVYNGQAVNLTPKTLAAAARVVSVEARHAAWARALGHEDPAPVAVDVPITIEQAKHVFQPYIA